MADWITAVAALAAVVVAGWQLHLGRRDSNRRATVELLGRLDPLLRDQHLADVPRAQRDLVQSYLEGQDVTPRALAYMALLNHLDTCALAQELDIVDKATLTRYLKTVTRIDVVSVTYLDQLCSVSGDPHVYEDLRRFLHSIEPRR